VPGLGVNAAAKSGPGDPRLVGGAGTVPGRGEDFAVLGGIGGPRHDDGASRGVDIAVLDGLDDPRPVGGAEALSGSDIDVAVRGGLNNPRLVADAEAGFCLDINFAVQGGLCDPKPVGGAKAVLGLGVKGGYSSGADDNFTVINSFGTDRDFAVVGSGDYWSCANLDFAVTGFGSYLSGADRSSRAGRFHITFMECGRGVGDVPQRFLRRGDPAAEPLGIRRMEGLHQGELRGGGDDDATDVDELNDAPRLGVVVDDLRRGGDDDATEVDERNDAPRLGVVVAVKAVQGWAERGRRFDGTGWIGALTIAIYAKPGTCLYVYCDCAPALAAGNRRMILCVYHHFDQSKVTYMGRKNLPFNGPWAKSDCFSEQGGVEVGLGETRPAFSGARARRPRLFPP
jgi:hypothetical protein